MPTADGSNAEAGARPFLWFGLTLLLVMIGPCAVGFLGLISWGALLFPLLALALASPLFVMSYWTQRKDRQGRLD
jgi:hypothetical protein